MEKFDVIRLLSDVNRFNEIIAGTFGPQMINVIVNQNETAKYLAEKMNLPEKPH